MDVNMQADLDTFPHSCDIWVHAPGAVHTFGHMCAWCRTCVGELHAAWSYVLLNKQAPWHIQFQFLHQADQIQFGLTFS
jgi:hypothetical protein